MRISTPAQEGQFQAAKWLKIQALVDREELAQIFEEEFQIFPLSGIFAAFPMKKEDYLKAYASWIEMLKQGVVPTEFKPLNAVAFTTEEAIWLQEIPGKGYIAKPCAPFVQVQVHQMGFSDGEFRPMILSQESIFWGLQFSFPQVYQDPKTMDLIELGESDLFKTIRRWIRNATIATPMLVNGKRQNIPIRLGKQCFSWINDHPQLKLKGLCVLNKSTQL